MSHNNSNRTVDNTSAGVTILLGDASGCFVGDYSTGGNTITLGDGARDSVVDYSASQDIITLGDGVHDSVMDHSTGGNIITLGSGVGDAVFEYGIGNDTITLGNGDHDIVGYTSPGNSTITLGNGAGDHVYIYGNHGAFGDNVVHLGNGNDDFVSMGAGSDTVTLGTGSRDAVLFNVNHSIVTFGGPDATADFQNLSVASFPTPTTTAQTSIVTSNVNIVSGLVAGDQIILPAADAVATANNMAGVAGEAVFTTGTYSAGGGTFTYSATGHDALLTYDAGGAAFISVVLVGGASEIGHATEAGHIITF